MLNNFRISITLRKSSSANLLDLTQSERLPAVFVGGLLQTKIAIHHFHRHLFVHVHQQLL